MTSTNGDPSTDSESDRVIGIALLAFVPLGFLAVFAIYNFGSDNDNRTQVDTQQDSTKSSTFSLTEISLKPSKTVDIVEDDIEAVREPPSVTLFSSIARKDPLRAISLLNSVKYDVDNVSAIVRRIVHEWSAQDPDTAADWIVEHYAIDDPLRYTLLKKTLLQLANQEPDKAFKLAIEQPNPDEGPGLDFLVFQEVVLSGEIELAKDLLPQVNESTKTYAYEEIGSAMIRKSMIESALEIGEDLIGPNRVSYYNQVLEVWAEHNPNNLFESLDKLPTSRVKSTAAKQLLLNNRDEPILNDDQIALAKTFLNSADKSHLQSMDYRYKSLESVILKGSHFD